MQKHEKTPLTHEKTVISYGKDAWDHSLPLTANPYLEGTNDSRLWALGWLEKNNERKPK